MSAAAEVYQRHIEQALAGLPGVKNMSDDIIIGGKNENELIKRIDHTLQRLREKNLTVNLKKCEFLQDELVYMVHKLSATGVSPDKERVDAIKVLKEPSNVHKLRSFLGMITYCSKFILQFATLTEPLRNLLRKGTVSKIKGGFVTYLVICTH